MHISICAPTNLTPSSKRTSAQVRSTLLSHQWPRLCFSLRRRMVCFAWFITSWNYFMNSIQSVLQLTSDELSVGAHMLIYIDAQSQSKYILVFSLILFLYYFHFTVRTPFQFFPKFSLFFLPFYSLQKPVILTWHC